MARILLIDDDNPVRGILAEILGRAGHQVTQARDGREGLDLIRATRFDLVLTDILMPELDGVETIMALRYGHPDLPVIAMSGSITHTNLYLQIAERLGVRRTLAKPFTAELLLDTVDSVLGIAA